MMEKYLRVDKLNEQAGIHDADCPAAIDDAIPCECDSGIAVKQLKEILEELDSESRWANDYSVQLEKVTCENLRLRNMIDKLVFSLNELIERLPGKSHPVLRAKEILNTMYGISK
jgi:hypothetical protein